VSSKPWYGATWRALRPQILRRDSYTCQIRRDGCTHRATTVDHIIPISRGGDWWDPANLQAACRWCNGGKRNGFTVGAQRATREW